MKRSSSCNFVASLLIAISCCVANAQDDPGGDQAQDERTQRLKAMRQRIETLKLTANDEQELKIDDVALFRYSDPTRGIIDATMWAISSGGRPNAILALEYCDNATAKYELTAVAHPPKRVSATRLD